MATSADMIAAQADADLRQRAAAIGAKLGYLPYEVEARIPQIVATSIPAGDTATTIADVYAYAVATYAPAPRPGQNLAAVTDSQLEAAITKTMTPTT